MLLVYGAILAEPDSIAEMTAEGITHSRRSRTEDGCIEHILYVDTENPMRLFFFEKWRDRAALDEHFNRPAPFFAFMRVVRRLNRSQEKMEVKMVD